MEFERITLYTWQDVENYLYMDRPGWPNEWKDIDVYNTEIVIYTQEINDRVKSKSNEYLKELLRQYYSNGKVRIPITDTTMEIVWEETDEEIEGVPSASPSPPAWATNMRPNSWARTSSTMWLC